MNGEGVSCVLVENSIADWLFVDTSEKIHACRIIDSDECVGQISALQKTIGQMCVGQMSVGQVSVGQIFVLQILVG